MLQLTQIQYIMLYWGVVTAAVDDCCTQKSTSQRTDLEILFDKIIPRDYNYQQPPSDNQPEPISVMFIYLSVSQVVFAKMEFEVEFIVRVEWSDSRLTINSLLADKELRNITVIGIPQKTVKRLWIPKISFANCKNCGMGPVIRSDHPILFHSKQKKFFTFYRDTMTFACMFDLSNYPFDSHECSVNMILMEHFSRSTKKPKLKDLKDLKRLSTEAIKYGMPPEFQFLNLSMKQACSLHSSSMDQTDDQCLQYGIRVQRIASYHLMLVFCPTTAIVMISWISFWLSVEASAPRVSLGLTSLLTLTTQFASEQKSLPPVAYVKALDIWMLVCVFMVFGSLLEFALAHNCKFRKKTVHNTMIVKEEPHVMQMHPLPGVNNPVSTRIRFYLAGQINNLKMPCSRSICFNFRPGYILLLLFFLLSVVTKCLYPFVIGWFEGFYGILSLGGHEITTTIKERNLAIHGINTNNTKRKKLEL